MDTLLVVGDGPVSEALAPMARILGWDPRVAATLADVEAVLPSARAVVVTSHDHEVGPAAIKAALETEAVVYIGGMGARRTQEARRAWLTEHGVSAEAQAQVRGPAGLDIGADGPGEIALSILAELVSTVRGGRAGSISDRDGPIHPELGSGEAFCPTG